MTEPPTDQRPRPLNAGDLAVAVVLLVLCGLLVRVVVAPEDALLRPGDVRDWPRLQGRLAAAEPSAVDAAIVARLTPVPARPWGQDERRLVREAVNGVLRDGPGSLGATVRQRRLALDRTHPESVRPLFDRTLFLALAVGNTLWLGLLAVYAACTGLRPATLGLSLRGWRRDVAEAAVWLVGAFAVTLLVNVLVRAVLTQEQGHPALSFFHGSRSAGDWLLVLYVLIPLAAIDEELLYRGLLLGCLRSLLPAGRGWDWTAAAAVGVAFGAAHGGWPDQIALAVFGAILGLAYLHRRRLLAPILIHAGFNAAQTVLAAYTLGSGAAGG